jgi:hypothetical protein
VCNEHLAWSPVTSLTAGRAVASCLQPPLAMRNATQPVSGLAAATLDVLPQSVYIVDRHLTIVAWNARREQGPLGLARVRALGRNLRDVLSRTGFHSVLPALGHVLETGTPFEEVRTTSDGRRTYRIRRVPITSDGEVTHVVTLSDEVPSPAADSNSRALAAARLALYGVIPVCAWCKKIRDQRGDWHQVEAYLATRSDASFTHGICDDCAGRTHVDDGAGGSTPPALSGPRRRPTAP